MKQQLPCTIAVHQCIDAPPHNSNNHFKIVLDRTDSGVDKGGGGRGRVSWLRLWAALLQNFPGDVYWIVRSLGTLSACDLLNLNSTVCMQVVPQSSDNSILAHGGRSCYHNFGANLCIVFCLRQAGILNVLFIPVNSHRALMRRWLHRV